MAKMINEEKLEPRRVVTRKVARGYLYAKVDEFTTVTDIKEKDYPSFKDMEQDFKEWLWGTTPNPKP